LEAAQRRFDLGSLYYSQRATRAEERQSAKQDELSWQKTAIEKDKLAAVLQKARQDQHHAEQYQHAQEIESQIDERNTQRRSQTDRKQQVSIRTCTGQVEAGFSRI
jgi:hypothetical protein